MMRIYPLFCIFALGIALAQSAGGSDLRLIDAVRQGNRSEVRALLLRHVDVNSRQGDGATALTWAAHLGDEESAELLIHAGADVNAANEFGVTPLWLACSKANVALIEKLLSANADPNKALLSGETPLMVATANGSIESVKLLLNHGAKVNAKESEEGQTALMWAAAKKYPEITRVLVANDADVRAKTHGGFTPLLFAAQQGDLESARLLIEAGADVNEGSLAATPSQDSSPVNGNSRAKQNGTGQSSAPPLLIAVSSGQLELTSFLLEHGADPNVVDRRGLTPLHYAAARKNMLTVVKSLLAHGARPNVRLPNNVGGLGVTEMSVSGATPLFLAAVAGNSAGLRLLAAAGADPRIGTEKNTTALMVAAGVGLFENRRGGDEQPALETVKLLVELGSDVNAVGERNWTALHGAAYTGSNRIVQFLVEKGAKLDVMDEFGQTPLSIAAAIVTPGVLNDAYKRARNYRRDTAELLLKLGATPLAASGVQSVEGFLPSDFSTITVTDTSK